MIIITNFNYFYIIFLLYMYTKFLNNNKLDPYINNLENNYYHNFFVLQLITSNYLYNIQNNLNLNVILNS
jgi:hypothetical protein